MEEDSRGTELGNVIRIDDERVRDHLGRIVRGTVEETLNAMLEAEADRLCNAGRYERTQARLVPTLLLSISPAPIGDAPPLARWLAMMGMHAEPIGGARPTESTGG